MKFSIAVFLMLLVLVGLMLAFPLRLRPEVTLAKLEAELARTQAAMAKLEAQFSFMQRDQTALQMNGAELAARLADVERWGNWILQTNAIAKTNWLAQWQFNGAAYNTVRQLETRLSQIETQRVNQTQ